MIPDRARPSCVSHAVLLYDEATVRRIASILLVLLFGLGPVSPLLEAEDARLPACCRGNGAHHCAMSAALMARMLHAEQRTHGFSAPRACPLYRTFLDRATAAGFALLPPVPEHRITARAASSAPRRLAPHSAPRARQNPRGPPASQA